MTPATLTGARRAAKSAKDRADYVARQERKHAALIGKLRAAEEQAALIYEREQLRAEKRRIDRETWDRENAEWVAAMKARVLAAPPEERLVADVRPRRGGGGGGFGSLALVLALAASLPGDER